MGREHDLRRPLLVPPSVSRKHRGPNRFAAALLSLLTLHSLGGCVVIPMGPETDIRSIAERRGSATAPSAEILEERRSWAFLFPFTPEGSQVGHLGSKWSYWLVPMEDSPPWRPLTFLGTRGRRLSIHRAEGTDYWLATGPAPEDKHSHRTVLFSDTAILDERRRTMGNAIDRVRMSSFKAVGNKLVETESEGRSTAWPLSAIKDAQRREEPPGADATVPDERRRLEPPKEDCP